MLAYQAGDFAAAIPLLEEAVRRTPEDDAARFYLGASYALSARWQDAVGALAPVATRSDSPYAEEAAFISAAANVHLDDLPAAIGDLDRTIALDGDRLAEAKAIRARLAALPPR